jgi:hypothetical protein
VLVAVGVGAGDPIPVVVDAVGDQIGDRGIDVLVVVVAVVAGRISVAVDVHLTLGLLAVAVVVQEVADLGNPREDGVVFVSAVISGSGAGTHRAVAVPVHIEGQSLVDFPVTIIVDPVANLDSPWIDRRILGRAVFRIESSVAVEVVEGIARVGAAHGGQENEPKQG